ncbi:MAG: response regulator [Desulfonatronovibrio sp.]
MDKVKPKILFVDDEQYILDGLKRMLRSMRSEWDMHFALNAGQAMEIMDKHPADVIVSDMRMPGISGADLLTRVMEKYPKTIRIILSGHSKSEAVMQTVLPAHQYLAKPCDPKKLKSVIVQALKTRKYITDHVFRSVISRISSLPSVPEVYVRVMDELASDDPSLPKVGKIISMDVSMCAQLLKLVNSSFFGFFRRISSPEQAATLLGMNVLRSLILSVHIFSVYDFSKVQGFSLSGLWEHCLASAKLAQGLARIEGLSREEAGDCYMGGVLHDVGKLVLASQMPEQYNAVLEKVRQEKILLSDAEQEVLGATHAEVGAYLMALWGLPEAIVEAIAYHHQPRVSNGSFQPQTAVYAANILEKTSFVIHPDYTKPELDREYLESMSLTDKIPAWEEMALKIGRSKTENGREPEDQG